MLKLTNKIKKRILGNKSLLFFIFLLALVVCLFLIYYFYKKTTHIEGIDIKTLYMHFCSRKDGESAVDIQVDENERLYITYVSYGSNKDPTKNSTENSNSKYVDILNKAIGSTAKRYYLSEFLNFDILGDPERGKVKYLYIEYIGIPFVNDPTFTPKNITVSDGNTLNINVDNNYVIKLLDAYAYKGTDKPYNNRDYGDIRDQIQIKIGYKSSFSNTINISDLLGWKLSGYKLSITYTQVKKINNQTTRFLKDNGITKYESFFYKNIKNHNYVKLGSYFQQEIGIDDNGVFQKYPIGVSNIRDPSKPLDIAKRIAGGYNSVIYGIYNGGIVAHTQTIPSKLYKNINNKQICGDIMGCMNNIETKSIINIYIDKNSKEYNIINKLGKADRGNFDNMIKSINQNDDTYVVPRNGVSYPKYTRKDNTIEGMSFYFIKKGNNNNYIFLPIISASVNPDNTANVYPKIENSAFYNDKLYGVYDNRTLFFQNYDGLNSIVRTTKSPPNKDIYRQNKFYGDFYACLSHFVSAAGSTIFCNYDIEGNAIQCFMLNSHKSYISIVVKDVDKLYNYLNNNPENSINSYLSNDNETRNNTKEVFVYSDNIKCSIILQYSYIYMEITNLSNNGSIYYCIALDSYGDV